MAGCLGANFSQLESTFLNLLTGLDDLDQELDLDLDKPVSGPSIYIILPWWSLGGLHARIDRGGRERDPVVSDLPNSPFESHVPQFAHWCR